MAIPFQTPAAFVVFGLAGSFQVGYHSSVYNQPQDIMEKFVASSYLYQYGAPASESYVTFMWSFIVSCYAIGALFLDFFAQYAMDRCGRKGAILIATFLSIVGASLQGLAYALNRYQLLIFGRLITGGGASLGVVTQLILLAETAPTKIRGTAGASIHVMAVVATIIANFLGFPWALGTSTLWPYLHVIDIIILLFFYSIAWKFPESPKSLSTNRNRDDLALRSLTYYNPPGTDVDGLLETIHAEAKEDEFVSSQWRIANLAHFLRSNKSFRKISAFFISISLAIPFCGYFLMLSFAVYILMKAGLTKQTAHYAALSYCFVNLLAALIGLRVIENHGRRKMTLTGAWVTFSCLFVIFICQLIRESDVVASATALAVFSISAVLLHAAGKASLVCANDALKGELFPSFIRATTVIYTGNIWTNCGNVFLSICYLPIERNIGSWALLILLIVPMMGIGSILTKLCPETKGKHVSNILQEIRETEIDTGNEELKLVD